MTQKSETCIKDRMPVRLVGKDGVLVSLLGLGGAPLANFFRPIPDEEIVELIRFSLEKGLRFFDTAPRYGKGLSEQRLGRVLQQVPRQQFTLATKVGWIIQLDGKIQADFTRDGIRRSLEESLQRLGLECVDILHIHDPDHHYRIALNETFPALAELRAQGLIGAIGAGMNQWEMLEKFAREADFDCFMMAGRYTLLEQESLKMLDLCAKKGIAVFLGGVYNTGILATGAVEGARYNYRTATPEVLERVRKIEAVCTRYHVPLQAAAMQFPTGHPAVASLVVGAECTDEIEEAIDGLCVTIPSELWQELQAEGLIRLEAPLPG